MKLAAAWLFLIALVAGFAASTSSCSLEHRTDLFACERSDECNDGRQCRDGYCVYDDDEVPIDASRIDGPTTRPDSGPTPIDGRPMVDAPPTDLCPVQCTSCEPADNGQKVCIVDCDAANDDRCGGQINCPPGFVCDVRCNTQNSCRMGINCGQATQCLIECSGEDSCRNVLCGEGPCDVECTGLSSCRAIGCMNSCACDVACFLGSECTNVQCPSQQCRDFIDGGCTSDNDGCNTCQ